MPELLKEIEKIEAYYEGKLSEDAKAEFERRLESSAELQEELELYKTVRSGLKDLSEEKKLKELLKITDKKLDNRKGIIRWMLPLGIAASVIGITFAVWVNYFSKSKYQILADKYYISDPGLPVFMSDKSNITLDKAMQLYQDKEFSEAMEKLKELRNSDTTTYYIGLCMFNLNQDAANKFGEVYNDKQSIFRDRAIFYEVLALLKNKKIDEAKRIIKALSANEKYPFIDNIKKLEQESLLNKQ